MQGRADEYQDVTNDCLGLHNKYRAEGLDVGVPKMSASDEARTVVLGVVKARAETKCANSNHSSEASNKKMGENIFFSSNPNCGQAVKMWYDEVKLLKGKYPGKEWGSISGIGHFTQVLWEKSTGLACAKTTNCPGMNQLFCVYNPGGNYLGVAPFSEEVWKSILKRDGGEAGAGDGAAGRISASYLALPVIAMGFLFIS